MLHVVRQLGKEWEEMRYAKISTIFVYLHQDNPQSKENICMPP